MDELDREPILDILEEVMENIGTTISETENGGSFCYSRDSLNEILDNEIYADNIDLDIESSNIIVRDETLFNDMCYDVSELTMGSLLEEDLIELEGLNGDNELTYTLTDKGFDEVKLHE